MYALDEDYVEGNYYNGNAHSENGFVTDGDLEVNEYLAPINDDFVPRRSAQPYLRSVYPAGFDVAKHRQLGIKSSLNEMDSSLYDSLASSSAVKGIPPASFSFVSWTKGGAENIIDDNEQREEDDADPYLGVAGRFRRVKPRRQGKLKDRNKRIHPLKEFKLHLK